MGRFFIGLFIGCVVGAALIYFAVVGVPRASLPPGEPIHPPNGVETGDQPQLVLRGEFFNEILAVIFRDMKGPTFPLAANEYEQQNEYGVENAVFQDQASQCDGRITILKEGSGVQTGVNFLSDRLAARLAFSGNYNSPFGCLQFTGWAQTNLELRFDRQQQAVYGIVSVETVDLDGVNPILNGFVMPLVQSTLNSRVNPMLIIDGKQLGIRLPIASSRGTLRADVSDVRAEVKDQALNLYIGYDLKGAPMQ